MLLEAGGRHQGHAHGLLPRTRAGVLLRKRLLDLVVAVIAVVLLAPLLLLIALLIRLDSSGPALFCQQRVGARPRRRGKEIEWEIAEFRIFKFRTMVRDASAAIHAQFTQAFVAGELDAGGPAPYKLDGDARVTRVGRWLRRTSLDELPQLINVIAGQMSLVGPRPVPPYEVALYEERHMARLAALPGMTGTWQVEGRGRTSFEQMVGMDVEYVRRQSVRRDLWLLVRTVPSVLSRNGAR